MATAEPPRRLRRRLAQLYAGLVLYGVSMAMLILSSLGNMPWDVLHEGIAEQAPLGIGAWVVIVSGVVLLLWIPLRVRPGLGTISNVLILGVVLHLILRFVEEPHHVVARISLLAVGVVLNGVATGLYIGARFGPGPRDGLMIGLAARGWSVRVARTAVEVGVVAIGAVLGGTLGIGTIAYALAIGPLSQWFIPMFRVPTK
ncbi:MAG: hypothetical protein JWM86_2123 [Thermoleophilia bacterium]|nr:hypothetical protein [Thermoleophilia bacterium]